MKKYNWRNKFSVIDKITFRINPPLNLFTVIDFEKITTESHSDRLGTALESLPLSHSRIPAFMIRVSSRLLMKPRMARHIKHLGTVRLYLPKSTCSIRQLIDSSVETEIDGTTWRRRRWVICDSRKGEGVYTFADDEGPSGRHPGSQTDPLERVGASDNTRVSRGPICPKTCPPPLEQRTKAWFGWAASTSGDDPEWKLENWWNHLTSNRSESRYRKRLIALHIFTWFKIVSAV